MGESSGVRSESAWLRDLAATSTAPVTPALEPGTELCRGRYVVQRELGRGGMGVVYAVRDEEQQRDVALKTLTRRSPTDIYRIKREFRGLSDVVHPNLVRLHELFEDQGRWCFTLELVPGNTLLRALRGAPPAALCSALRQLAEGIAALHEAGKLHRDIKPSNVMLTPLGRVVILDFGLAEDIAERIPRACWVTSGRSGTPAYMAPELIAGAAGPSQASDWYAYGVILWELLTGQLRATPETQPAFIPAELDICIPGTLADLCRELLQPDPAARPSATQVLRGLAGDASQSGVPAATPPGARRALSSTPPRELVGRAQELARMRQAFAAHLCGHRPGVLLLSGESGIGKTALVQAFVNELAGTWVLAGRCYERELVPYKGFDAAVDELCRHLNQLSPAELSQVLPADFSTLCRLFPVLGRIEAPPGARPVPLDEGDVHELRRRGFEALGVLLGRMRRQQPVVLWLDDLQWTDADSTRLLLHLLRQPSAPAIFVVASHRSEGDSQPPALQALYETLPNDVRLDVWTLALGPLGRGDARALLEAISPGAPPALIEQAGGHPFLLEELSLYSARRSPTGGGWPSLPEAIRARVDALPADERHLLELLSIAGRPLLSPLAHGAAGPGWQVAVQALCGARLARRSALDGSLSCYHDAIREAVLGAVAPGRARTAHRSLALAMLRTAEAPAEHLARHLLGAGHPARAAEQMAIAARRAAASLAFERAAQLYQSAIELGRFAPERLRDLRVARAHALAAAGRGTQAAELYLEVLRAGQHPDDLELRTRAAEQYLLCGRLEQGLELLRSALRPLRVPLRASALGTIGSFLLHRARLRVRGYHFEARPVNEAVARQIALLQRASFALARLDPLRASDLASRALVLALETGCAEAIAGALVDDLVMGVMFRVSDAELARRRERAERACAQHGGPQEQATLQTALALGARLKSQPDLPAALFHLEQFFEIHRQHVLPRASYERAWEQWARALVRCWNGELAQVAREVPAHLDDGWSRGDHCIVPLWAGGDVLFARLAVGDVTAAARDLDRARRAWSSTSFTLQDLMLAIGEFRVARQRGEPRAGWQVAETARQRLQTSPLRRMPNVVDLVVGLRGHAALELARHTQSPSERRELVQLVRRTLRSPPKRPNLLTMYRGDLLAAALHFQLGEPEQAALALERVEPNLQSMPLYAHAVRYRRATLLGAPAPEAAAFLAATGAADPERLVDLLLPGYAGGVRDGTGALA